MRKTVWIVILRIYIWSFEYSMAEKSTKHSLLQLQLLEREDGGGGKQSGIRDYVSVAPDTLQPCVAPSPPPWARGIGNSNLSI